MELPNPGTLLRFVLLAAGVVLSTVLFLQTRPPDIARAETRLNLAYYLDTAELTGSGPDGNTLYRVRTRRASHVVADDSIAMLDVEMVYTPEGPQGWNLSSSKGRIPADVNIIELTEDVIVQSGAANRAATKITTTRLDVDPATRQARTEAPVVVDYDGQVVNAVGLEADLKRNQLKLLSKVNGKFSQIVE